MGDMIRPGASPAASSDHEVEIEYAVYPSVSVMIGYQTFAIPVSIARQIIKDLQDQLDEMGV